MDRLAERIRLEHKMLEGRYHVYTSPDVKGFHVSSDTLAGAQREAIAVLDAIARHQGVGPPAVEFSEQLAA